jgi:DNA-binding response OmpR family regulator
VFDINKANSISFDVVRRIRELSVIPIMLVLHGMARNDILRGFQVGADAYVLAPFDEREFGARIRALLQRIPVRSKAV